MIWYKTQPTNLLNLVKLVADKIFTHGTDERQKRKRIIDNYQFTHNTTTVTLMWKTELIKELINIGAYLVP